MDKLNLNLDDLEVDSFQTNPEQEGEQGTVQGNDHSCHSCDPTCDGPTCNGVTCDGGYTCDGGPCLISSVRCETDEFNCTAGELCV